MQPVLFSIGPFPVFSFSIFIILAWLMFSFQFWRISREYALTEEHAFDLMFYGTVSAFLFSRLTYVFIYWSIFAPYFLKIFAIWVSPGLSFYGALMGVFIVMVPLSKLYKIRIGTLIDILGQSLLPALIIGNIASFLDGSVYGKISDRVWSINYVGHIGLRHPIQIYSILSLIVIVFVLYKIRNYVHKNRLPAGIIGLWFFLLFSLSHFFIEFIRQNDIYLLKLTILQWILLAIFCESAGGLYIRGGGKIFLFHVREKIKNTYKKMIKKIYEFIQSGFFRSNKTKTT